MCGHVPKMIIQAGFAELLMVGYLWLGLYPGAPFFPSPYITPGLANTIYMTINVLISLMSMLTSIIGAIYASKRSTHPSSTKVLLCWLIVQIVYVLHLVVLYVFIILTIATGIQGTYDSARRGLLLNFLAAISFVTSMVLSIWFMLSMLSMYRELKNEGSNHLAFIMDEGSKYGKSKDAEDQSAGAQQNRQNI